MSLCKNGHERATHSYINSKGQRICRQCQREADNRYRRKMGIPPKVRSIREKFHERYVVDWETGCWNWASTLNRQGYGTIAVGNSRTGNHKRLAAHRLSYELLRGPIPEGLSIDHLCRNRACVNPAHLEPVTHRENVLRGASPPAQQARQRECVRGHSLEDEDNIYIDNRGRRHCRTCINIRAARFRERHRLQLRLQQRKYHARQRAESA